MAMILDEKSLSKLREFLKTRNFTDKYFQTAQLVHKFDGVADIKKNLNVVKTLYEDLLYEYPFNFAFWSNFANFYINIQLYDTAVQIYDEAVSLNNTSPELWNLYITFVLQYYGNTNGKAIEVYERAIQAIQYDVNAGLIWNSYLDFLEQNDPLKAHTLYWRAIDYPVVKPNEMIQRYGKFLHGLDHLQYLDFIESRKDLAFPPEANISKHLTLQLYTQRINHAAIINPPADSENKLSSLLERVEFNGEELDPIKDRALKSYLAKQKKVLNHEKLVYLHEKCLVAKCKSGDFWMKILHLLDKHHSTRYLVDEYLIKYEKLYSVIDKREQILFFQADIKERERDIVSCREIYKELQKSGVFEAYLRHLYMEIRTLNIQYILEIFVSLCQSVKNPDQIMFVVQEMSETFKKLEELEKILVIVTQLEKKLPEYSRFFYLTWVNFLINCERPWEEIAGVFELAFAKVATDEDKQGLWRFYAYTTRRYCHDINVVREVEKRHAWRVEPGQELEGTETAKRLFGSFHAPHDYTVDEIVKKVKMG